MARDLGGLPARLAALMVASEPGGSLAPRLLAFAVPGTGDGRGDGRVPVAVLVELPAADVLVPGTDRAPEDRGLDLHVYAVEPGGTVAGFLAQRVPLPPGGPREPRGTAGPSAARPPPAPVIRFLGRLELAPGEHLLRLLVHHAETGRFGRAQLRLTVPEADAAAWPELAETRRDGGEEAGGGSAVFLVHQGDEEAGRVERVEALARGLAEAAVPLGRVDFFGGGSRTEPEVGRADAEAPSGRGGAGSQASEPARELAAAYARAVALLPVGWGAAAEALAAAEERVLAAEPVAGAQVLDRVERAEAAQLAAGRAEVLLPLALLHRRLFHRHARAGRHVAAVIARGLAVDLAEAHVLGVSGPGAGSGSRDPGAVRRARRLLVDLAAELLSRGALSAGEKILARADGLDPDRPDALTFLLAAVAAERRGDHAATLVRLRRIDPGRHAGRRELADPVTAEATLRLAVNLARAGAAEEAAARLDRLLAAAPPDWILSVAYHERARLLREEGRLDPAAALLRRGLERQPDDASLRVALAHLEDRRGEPAAARELLAGISPAPAGRPSPRRRYSSWPHPLLDASRRALEAAAEARMEPLVETASAAAAAEAPPGAGSGAGAGG